MTSSFIKACGTADRLNSEEKCNSLFLFLCTICLIQCLNPVFKHEMIHLGCVCRHMHLSIYLCLVSLGQSMFVAVK